MIHNIEEAIRTYLSEVIHLSLATSVNDMPWVCEVHYAFDTNLNLYFRSTPTRRHSKELTMNPRVAGTIVKQHAVGQKPRGVYFEGNAQIIHAVDEHHIAYIRYCERFGTDQSILEESHNENGHKFYIIRVNTFYLFDSIESNPSQKYELPWHGRHQKTD